MKIFVTIMIVLSIACNALSPAPKWSEAEAIAVVKSTCQVNSFQNRCLYLHGELHMAPVWSAEYDSEEKRWAVTLAGESLFGNPLDPIVSYVYENTKTVEWNVNK